MIRFHQVSLRRGIRRLLEDASFTLHAGEKIGITGANGAGKSSLMALLRGELALDAGKLDLPPNLAIAHVAQETPAVSTAAIDYAMEGDDELTQLTHELALAETEADGTRLAHLHQRMDDIGGYTARARAATLLHGLGFLATQYAQPVADFSGGWRMRLNLARALMCRSDLLLLDEPTNHLDLDAVLWLQDWLKKYPGTLLLISHDREFLDEVVDHILHIEQGRAMLYTGNYSDFERQRAERLAQQQSLYVKQQRERAHIQHFIDRFRAQATKARQAQSRMKAMERMQLIAPAHADSPFHFEFAPPKRLPAPLLVLNQVDIGYGDTALIKGIKRVLNPGDRIGLIGANGAGKSTLIKTLACALPPLAGEITKGQDLLIGYFAQHQLEQLHPQQSVLEHLQALDKQATEQSLRDFAGGFGFRGDDATAPIAPFSGGEKARLALALIVYRRPNLLLLDEPTNHLDLDMRHAVTVALQGYQGALVVVSHDRHLLRTVTDELWLVANGRVQDFDGDLDDYRRWLLDKEAAANSPQGEAAAPSRKDQRRLDAERRKRQQPLKDALRRVETAMEKNQSEKAKIEEALADSEIYADSRKDQLKKLLLRRSELDQALSTLEAEWLSTSEALEQLEKE